MPHILHSTAIHFLKRHSEFGLISFLPSNQGLDFTTVPHGNQTLVSQICMWWVIHHRQHKENVVFCQVAVVCKNSLEISACWHIWDFSYVWIHCLLLSSKLFSARTQQIIFFTTSVFWLVLTSPQYSVASQCWAFTASESRMLECPWRVLSLTTEEKRNACKSEKFKFFASRFL